MRNTTQQSQQQVSRKISKALAFPAAKRNTSQEATIIRRSANGADLKTHSLLIFFFFFLFLAHNLCNTKYLVATDASIRKYACVCVITVTSAVQFKVHANGKQRRAAMLMCISAHSARMNASATRCKSRQMKISLIAFCFLMLCTDTPRSYWQEIKKTLTPSIQFHKLICIFCQLPRQPGSHTNAHTYVDTWTGCVHRCRTNDRSQRSYVSCVFCHCAELPKATQSGSFLIFYFYTLNRLYLYNVGDPIE